MAGENGNGWSRLLLGAVGILAMTIMSAAFYYTSSVAEDVRTLETKQTDEKKTWRSEHNKVLDERFQKLEQNQSDLKSDIRTNMEKVDKGFDKVVDKLDRLSAQAAENQSSNNKRRAR